MAHTTYGVMSMRAKRKIVAVLSGMLMVLGFSVVVAPNASAAVSGTVTCNQGNVQGVYINKTGGSGYSGWASISPAGNVSSSVQYSFSGISAGASYYISAGCGGTPGNWQYRMYGPTVNGGYYDWICIVGYSGSTGGTNRCVES